MNKILLPIVLVLFACNVFGEDKEIADLRKKAEAGDAGAQFNLGLMYHFGQGVPKDEKEAAKWWRLSAEQGYADGQYRLGITYYLGSDVPKDYKEAAKWTRKAAEQGHARAQYHLGMIHKDGTGVIKDYVAAYSWYDLAASNGDEDGAKWPDLLAKHMTPEQIAKAQEMSKELLKQIEANKAAKKE